MANLCIENSTKKIKLIISDRDDQFNEINFYENDLISHNYKCRLENLSIAVLLEKLKTFFNNNIAFEIGYPNFIFTTEKSGDMISLKFTAYPSDYYKIELELGYISDIKLGIN